MIKLWRPFKLSLFAIFIVVSGSSTPSFCKAEVTNSFAGNWVANGVSEFRAFGKNRSYALFTLSGHVNLKSALLDSKDYWSECSGLSDSQTGSDVRCVWRSLSGEEIYLVLKAERLEEGSMVQGKIVGGTGTAEGIKGKIEFLWSTMQFQTVNGMTSIGGYAQNMQGTYMLP